jgi:uncharacterized protein (AIM24 family)
MLTIIHLNLQLLNNGRSEGIFVAIGRFLCCISKVKIRLEVEHVLTNLAGI